MTKKRSANERLYRFNVAFEVSMKKQLMDAAKREHRSLSNYIYVAVLEKMERDKEKK